MKKGSNKTEGKKVICIEKRQIQISIKFISR